LLLDLHVERSGDLEESVMQLRRGDGAGEQLADDVMRSTVDTRPPESCISLSRRDE
jgi:hypothetical protein